MALGYVMYPQQPPTLEELALELRTTDKGTQDADMPTPFRKRAYSVISFRPPDLIQIEAGIRAGYVSCLHLHQDPSDHAIIIIGIDGDDFLYHDPTGVMGPTHIDRSSLTRIGVSAIMVAYRPVITPSYKVSLSNSQNIQEYLIDSMPSASTELSFPLGTTHTISVPTALFSNGQSTKHICLNSKITVKSWHCETLNVTFLYVTYHLIKASMREENRTVETWVADGEAFTVAVKDTVLPASGLLGQLGSTRRFSGWYSEQGLLTKDSALQLEVRQPLSIEARYAEDYTSTVGIMLIMSAIVIALLSSLLIARKYHAQADQSDPYKQDNDHRAIYD